MQPHAALARVRAQRRPLALEPHLVGERAAEGRPVAAPERRGRATKASTSSRETGASGSASSSGRGGERRPGRVRRAMFVGRPERQDLPPRLACRGEPVDELAGVREGTARQRGRVKQDSGRPWKLHDADHAKGHRQETPAADPDPGRLAADRLRPLPGQGGRRRQRRGLGDDLPRRPRGARRRAQVPAEGDAQVARGADGRVRQRPLDGPPGRRRRRPLGVHGRGLGRPLRLLALGDPAQGRGRPERPRRASSPRARCSTASSRSASRRRSPTSARTGTRSRRCRSRSSSPSTASAPASARGTSSSRAPGAASRASRRCCPSWRSSASTSSTCRRSTRSARRTARARTTCSRRGRATRAARGRSAAEGGHDAIHPDLGTIEDFDRLVAAGREHGVEVCLDFAIQCSPDHPWLKEHPEWFNRRPGRDAQVRREPAQEVPGHLQRQLRQRGLAGALGGAARRGRVLGRPRRQGLPRRQPAHEAGAVLGVADRRDPQAATPTSSSSPRRSRGRR